MQIAKDDKCKVKGGEGKCLPYHPPPLNICNEWLVIAALMVNSKRELLGILGCNQQPCQSSVRDWGVLSSKTTVCIRQ